MQGFWLAVCRQRSKSFSWSCWKPKIFLVLLLCIGVVSSRRQHIHDTKRQIPSLRELQARSLLQSAPVQENNLGASIGNQSPTDAIANEVPIKERPVNFSGPGVAPTQDIKPRAAALGITQVASQQQLASAMLDASVFTIQLSRDVTLTTAWMDHLIPQGTVYLQRSLQLMAVPASSEEKAKNFVLDFGQIPFAIAVMASGTLAVTGLTLQGIAPAASGISAAQTSDDRLTFRLVGLPMWPSITAVQNAQISLNSSTVAYRDDSTANCTLFQSRLALQFQQIYGADFVSVPGDGVLLSGVHAVSLPVINTNLTSQGSQVVDSIAGYVVYTVSNFTGICELSNGQTFNGKDGRNGLSFPWWAAVILSLAMCALLLSTIAACVLRHRSQRLASNLKLSHSQAIENASGDLSHALSRGLPNGSGTNTSIGNMWSGNSKGLTGANNDATLQSQLSIHKQLLEARAGRGLDGVEIGPLLGRGSYGRVYKGRWNGALVAIKVIEGGPSGNEDAVNSAREGLLSASMSHPNVIATYKICSVRMGETKSNVDLASLTVATTSARPEHQEKQLDATQDGFHEAPSPELMETWMLLEFADRGSLDQAIKSKRFVSKGPELQLDMVAVYKTLLDIATGISYLHSLGIVHGDLKAANALLKSTVTDSRGFVCKIADFGLSRVLDLNSTHVSTQNFGTVPYMPPELLSSGRLSLATDAFSFAILMWELFTGTEPFKGMGFGQVMFNVVHKQLRPELPPDCPPGFLALMTSCWAQDETARPTFVKITAEIASLGKEAAAAAKQVAEDIAAAAAAAVETSSLRTTSKTRKGAFKKSATSSPSTLQDHSTTNPTGSKTSKLSPFASADHTHASGQNAARHGTILAHTSQSNDESIGDLEPRALSLARLKRAMHHAPSPLSFIRHLPLRQHSHDSVTTGSLTHIDVKSTETGAINDTMRAGPSKTRIAEEWVTRTSTVITKDGMQNLSESLKTQSLSALQHSDLVAAILPFQQQIPCEEPQQQGQECARQPQ